MSKSEPTTTEIRAAFGATMRTLRKERGIPQEELAYRARVDRGYLGGLERGQHTPSIQTLLRVSRALKMSAASFVRELERQLKHTLPVAVAFLATGAK